MSFKVYDNRLLRAYTKVLEKVNILIDIELDTEPVNGDNDKYIKAKIKSNRDKVNTLKKENASYKCLSMIMLDSVITVSKKYNPQTLLEECKKNAKIENIINDDYI